MGIQEILLKDKMLLVCYDFTADHKGNMERARLREELTGHPFWGKMMTQSVYYIPESVMSLSKVRRWAKSSKADIRVFGNVSASLDLKERKAMAREYYLHLSNIVKEVDDIAKRCRRELLEFEEDIDNPETTLRGWASKIASIVNRFGEIRSVINRIGNEDDEFHLDMLAVFVDNLNKRYEKVKEMKIRINKERKSKK